MKRLLLRLSCGGGYGAMVLALATPAFAFHSEGHIGGDTPGDKECNDAGCQGGGVRGIMTSRGARASTPCGAHKERWAAWLKVR